MKFIFAIILPVFSAAQPEQLDQNTIQTRETFGLKGEVKTYTEFKYYAFFKDGKVQKGKRVYDNMHDEMDQRKTFDRAGKLVLHEDIYYPGMNVVYSNTHYVYDNSGALVSPRSKNPEVVYDSVKRSIHVKYDKESGAYEHEYFYRYDKQGRLIQKLVHLPGLKYSGEKYFYDGNKRIVYEYGDTAKPEISVKFETYHSTGHLLEDSTWYAAKKYSIANKYAYDKTGNLILHYTFNDGKLRTKENFVYTFDGMGNCTRLIEYRNGTPEYLEEHIYTYYKNGK